MSGPWEDFAPAKPAASAPWEDFQSKGEEKTTSASGAFMRSAAKSVPGAAAGLAAFGPGATAGAAVGTMVAPGPGTVVGGVVGGLATAAAASWSANLVTNKLLDMIPQDVLKVVGLDKETLAADQQQHGTAVFAGELTANAVGMRPGGGLKAAAVGGALGAGIETGREAAVDGKLDPAKIAMATGAGALFNTPNKVGRALMREKAPTAVSEVPIQSKPGAATNPKEYTEELKSSYHKQMQGIEARKMEVVQGLQKQKGLQQAYQGVREELTHSDVPGAQLSPQAQKMKAQVVDPLAQNVSALRERIRGYGVDVGEDLEHYLPRIRQDSERQSIFETVGGIIPGKAKGGFGTFAGSLRDRTAVALDFNGGVSSAKPGFVRMYHGGTKWDYGSRWVTPDIKYAEGYASKNPESKVYYVDVPEDSPYLQKAFDDTGASQKAPYVHFNAPPEMAKDLKEVSNGGRMIATRDPKSGKVELWNDGKVVGSHKVGAQEWAEGQFDLNGVAVKRGQATVREIESHTPIRYFHDPIAALVDTKIKMEKVVANLDFIDALQHGPEAKNFVASGRVADKAPADWRVVEGMPRAFAQTKFEPHLAEGLEDIIGRRGENFWDQVGNVSRFITGSMFWNPMPHIWNVASHFAVEKGLVGGAAGLAKGTAKTLIDPPSNLTFQAIKGVVTRDETYRRFLKEGAGMMSPGPFNHDFAKQVMESLGTKPEMQGVAKAWGYANPRALVEGVYGASRKAMWGVNDMMLMQAYLAKEQSGMTAAQAVKDVERHIPNYQMPSRIMMDNKFGRMLSKGLQDPAVAAFGRYEYGRMASYGHMMKDVISTSNGIGDKAHAMDQMAMLFFMTFVAAPIAFDTMAKALTGNENATATRFGASAIPWWVDQYFHADDREFNKLYGTKTFNQVAQSAVLPAPGPKMAMELWTNTDTFRKKEAIEGPRDILSFAAENTLPPFREISDMVRGKKSVGDTVLKDTLGVNNPTETQLKKRDQAFVRDRAAALRKEKKRRQE